jgi:hypothetical protein
MALRLRALRIKLPEVLLEQLRSEDEVPVALIPPGEGARFGRMLADELIRIPGVGAGRRSAIARRIGKVLGRYEVFCKTKDGRRLVELLKDQLGQRFVWTHASRDPKDSIKREVGSQWRWVFERWLFAKSFSEDRVEGVPSALEMLRRRYEPQFAKSPNMQGDDE